MPFFFDFEAPDLNIAISNYIAAHFGQRDDDGQYIPPGVEIVRAWALETVNELATKKENALDRLIAGKRETYLNNEIVDYYKSGRPANPNPTIYAIANAMAIRRGINLRDMLEILLTKWLSIRERLIAIITELDRVTGEIEAAGNIEEIEVALASVTW